MKIYISIIFWLYMMAVGASRMYPQTAQPMISQIDNKPSAETTTAMTREALWKRMILKNVRFSESSDCHRSASSGKKTSDASDDLIRLQEEISKNTDPCDPRFPDPLALQIEITSSYRNSFKARLNNGEEEYDFDGLVSKLNSVFKERETRKIYQANTNDVDTRITLAASDDYISDYQKHNVMIEDIERLVDDLREKGIDEISVDFIGLLPFFPDPLPALDAKRKTTNQVQPQKRSKRRTRSM